MGHGMGDSLPEVDILLLVYSLFSPCWAYLYVRFDSLSKNTVLTDELDVFRLS
jgi:hypothetical protein